MKTFQSGVMVHLSDLSKKYSKSKGDWMTGSKLTYVDFLAYEVLDNTFIVLPEKAQEFANLNSFLDKFRNLDSIKDYLQSDRFNKFPIWSERYFIGRKENDWIV